MYIHQREKFRVLTQVRARNWKKDHAAFSYRMNTWTVDSNAAPMAWNSLKNPSNRHIVAYFSVRRGRRNIGEAAATVAQYFRRPGHLWTRRRSRTRSGADASSPDSIRVCSGHPSRPQKPLETEQSSQTSRRGCFQLVPRRTCSIFYFFWIRSMLV